MLPTEKKKLNTALNHLLELEGALLTLAAFVAYSLDQSGSLHVDVGRASTVEMHIRGLRRKARRIYLRVSEALNADPTEPAQEQ